MLRPRLTLALLVGAIAAGCGVASACPSGRTCGDARWYDEGAVVDGRRVTAEGLVAASPGLAPADARGDAMRVSSRPVFVRFDLSQLSSVAGVERAVLALSPHPAWRPVERPARLFARGVATPWSTERVAAGEAPATDDDVATATLAAGVRAPLRVDVTSIVRAWAARTATPEGISLELDGGEAVFAGVGAASPSLRPRLEVVVR